MPARKSFPYVLYSILSLYFCLFVQIHPIYTYAFSWKSEIFVDIRKYMMFNQLEITRVYVGERVFTQTKSAVYRGIHFLLVAARLLLCVYRMIGWWWSMGEQ